MATEELPGEGGRVQAAVIAAVQDALANEGCMMEHFVCVATFADRDGDRAIWTLTDSTLKAWDTIGLLDYGLTLQRARLSRRYTED